MSVTVVVPLPLPGETVNQAGAFSARQSQLAGVVIVKALLPPESGNETACGATATVHAGV